MAEPELAQGGWWSQRTRGQKELLVVGGVFVALLMLAAIAGGSDESASGGTTTTAAVVTPAASPAATTAKPSSSVEDSIEYKLAVIDEGGYVNPDDSIVGVYRSALNRAANSCPNSKQQLADMAVKGDTDSC